MHAVSTNLDALIVEVTAADADAGQRLDRVLSAHLPDVSRTRLQALIKGGQVACLAPAGTIGEPGHRVKPGDRYTVSLPPPRSAIPEGEAMPLAIQYEDDCLLVIDKPAGLVVHPAGGHATGTLVNAIIGHCGASLSGIGGVRRPGIVHRLDKDTSGLLVVAKSDAAHQALSAQFAAHGVDGRLTRSYLALVWGRPDPARGSIDRPLARSTANRMKMTVVQLQPDGASRGRRAVTHYEVKATVRDVNGKDLVSLIECRLETGRTHQIRVHLASIGHPVLGDQTYGIGFKSSAKKLAPEAALALEALGRQALHAAVLGFEHPASGKSMVFHSEAPADLGRLLDALGFGSAPPGRLSRNRDRR